MSNEILNERAVPDKEEKLKYCAIAWVRSAASYGFAFRYTQTTRVSKGEAFFVFRDDNALPPPIICIH